MFRPIKVNNAFLQFKLLSHSIAVLSPEHSDILQRFQTAAVLSYSLRVMMWRRCRPRGRNPVSEEPFEFGGR
jgi:hypothetical protein